MNNADFPAWPVGDASRGLIDTNDALRGLTKREAFAMAALQGLCANPNIMSKTLLEEIRDGVRGGRDLTRVAQILANTALEDKK